MPIKRTQSVGTDHLPLGIAVTMAQDNYEVQFKEELQKVSNMSKTYNSQSGIFQYYNIVTNDNWHTTGLNPRTSVIYYIY